eukprot:GHVU01087512.1.p1 GENE.GHVU01087512.1~~GHVU01087512.1.p1  ORF type:complete len:126 (-),score=4.22 GHVU01087512.1:150-527(-)
MHRPPQWPAPRMSPFAARCAPVPPVQAHSLPLSLCDSPRKSSQFGGTSTSVVSLSLSLSELSLTELSVRGGSCHELTPRLLIIYFLCTLEPRTKNNELRLSCERSFENIGNMHECMRLCIHTYTH